MCLTFGRSEMSNTIVYAGEALRGGRLVHVLGYSNKAKSLSGPNAMILPIPSAVPLTEKNAIDTTYAKNLLKDCSTAVTRDLKGASDSFGGNSRGMRSMKAIRFDVGSYTVVVGQNASDVHNVLQTVDISKRPKINEAILSAYARLYPEWPIAVCCFNADVAPEPLLWWYEPKDPSRLFAPGLDGHDGDVPNLKSLVRREHVVVFGSTFHPKGHMVHYQDDLSDEIATLFPMKVIGAPIRHNTRNGDWYVPVDHSGMHADYEFPTELPPGA